MPLTFPCRCGLTLSVRDDPPVYFVRCPVCGGTNKVPHPRPGKPAADPGFVVVDEYRPRSAYDKPPKPEDDDDAPPGTGYELGTPEKVERTATKGSGAGEPYEVTQAEWEAELRERRRGRAGRRFRRAVWLVVVGAFGIGAFALAGAATRAVDPAGKGRVGAGLARVAVLFTVLVVMLIVWLVNQVGDDD